MSVAEDGGRAVELFGAVTVQGVGLRLQQSFDCKSMGSCGSRPADVDQQCKEVE